MPNKNNNKILQNTMLPKLFTHNNKINSQISLKTFQNTQTTIIYSQKLPPIQPQPTRKYQPNPTYIRCQICYKQYPPQHMIKICKNDHIFCPKCVQQHIKSRMQDNQRLVCCMLDCQEDIISKIDIQLQLQQEKQQEKQKYKQQQMQNRTNRQKTINMKNTSFRQVDNINIANSSMQTIKQYKQLHKKLQQRCKNCKYTNTNTNQIQDNQNNNPKLLQKCQSCKALQQFLPQNCKICPNCSKPIQKQKGCDHVKCICQFQFCFRCTQQWSRNHFCKSRIPIRQGISYYIFFLLKIFVSILIFMPLFTIFLLLTLSICILTAFLFGSYLYIKMLQKISKSDYINDCFKIILLMLSLILFPTIVIICILPGFFLPFVNVCLKQENRIMYRTDFVYQLGESLFGCIMIVKLI